MSSVELRKAIMAVQKNSDLTPEQKTREIQKLLNPKRIGHVHENDNDDDDIAETKKKKTIDEIRSTLSEKDKEPLFQSEGVLGCQHYMRGCKYLADCCEEWFACRQCHDQKVVGHEIDRYATKVMMCMYCGLVQEWAKNCASEECGKDLGVYCCSVCRFHDDTPDKPIYHCDKCKMCRVGKGLGVDFLHCDACGVCRSLQSMADHVCIERNLHSECPICGDFLHTSVKSVVFMRCGHSIHHACLRQYERTNFVCPMCSKTIFDDPAELWANYQRIVDAQTMPPEFDDTTAIILCNDCNERSDVSFHFVAHRCTACQGFNTRVLETKNMPTSIATVVPAETLIEQEESESEGESAENAESEEESDIQLD